MVYLDVAEEIPTESPRYPDIERIFRTVYNTLGYYASTEKQLISILSIPKKDFFKFFSIFHSVCRITQNNEQFIYNVAELECGLINIDSKETHNFLTNPAVNNFIEEIYQHVKYEYFS